MELEALARKTAVSTWKTDLKEARFPSLLLSVPGKNEKWEISSEEFVRIAVSALEKGQTAGEIALRFHFQLIRSIAELTERLSEQTGIRHIVLSGGCMQNGLLLEGLSFVLKNTGFQVFTGEDVPINDGAISLGQTIIGGLQHVSRNSHEGD
jgi:hydrogenase maturation protein HypF